MASKQQPVSVHAEKNLFCTHEVFYAVDSRFTYIVQLIRTLMDNLPVINVYVLISKVSVQLPGRDGEREAEAHSYYLVDLAASRYVNLGCA